MARGLFFPEEISDYLLSVSLREPPILRRLREETASHPRANLQIPPEHGQFMALMIQLLGARRTIEVGVFTGYSSLAVALALPADGSIVACDVNEEFTSVARRYWKEAGVDHMIDLRLKPAIETLTELIAQGREGTFDFVFIDADKTGYVGYLNQVLQLSHSGTVILGDNLIRHGAVLPGFANPDADAVGVKTFNELIASDPRLESILLPILKNKVDGMSISRVK